MLLSQFDYQLPEELIAQYPAKQRDMSRLMVMDRRTGETSSKYFKDIKEYLTAGDALVLNDTRVFAARVMATKDGSGGKMEIFFLNQIEGGDWLAMVRPGRRIRPGTLATTLQGEFRIEVVGERDDGLRIVRVETHGLGYGEFFRQAGEIPLPPYIHQPCRDSERYQTVYSVKEGSVAAPTAGLHFTDTLLNELEAMGVHIFRVTLHVGIGTFKPVTVENIMEHQMHFEEYELTPHVAEGINKCKKNGKKIIAVGTTSVRTLETCGDEAGVLHPATGKTDKFIFPGYEFRVIDGMITNFHLPKSTLLMLVSAFAGRENILKAYQRGISEEYRFFSFGDAMLII